MTTNQTTEQTTAAKHTPGPWHLGVWPGPIVYGTRGEQVATLHVAMLPEEEHRANARLIASAPALVEALLQIVRTSSSGADCMIAVRALKDAGALPEHQD